MWDSTVEHAKTCILSGKLHVYYADEKQNIGVIFNNIFQLMGLIADGSYMSVDSLSDSEKVGVLDGKMISQCIMFEHLLSFLVFWRPKKSAIQFPPVLFVDNLGPCVWIWSQLGMPCKWIDLVFVFLLYWHCFSVTFCASSVLISLIYTCWVISEEGKSFCCCQVRVWNIDTFGVNARTW